MARSAKSKKIKFDRRATLGSLVAENDQFLEECFFDKGDLDIIINLSDHRCVVIGRTGAGKSALFEKLRLNSPDRVIAVNPNDLALSYIANDNVLRTYESLGVNLTPFYRLLWKHVFVTEITKRHYNLTNHASNETFLRRLYEVVRRDKAKEESVNYFREWGEKFWETTEYRVKEITRTVSQRLEATQGGSVTIPLPAFQGTAELSRTKAGELSEEQKGELLHHGQKVIQDIQISKLNRMIELLDTSILDDRQKYYYIIIDKLDDNWVEDELRYQLIFELITTVIELNSKLKYRVKILVALREDLLLRVYEFIRDIKKYQFQQEKYEDCYYRLGWHQSDLKGVIRKRVEALHARRLTPEQLTLEDIFASRIQFERSIPSRESKYPPIDYIIDRTMLTPRDAIRFFSRCLDIARTSESGTFTKTLIQKAEVNYSQEKLNAVIDEWRINYPNLREALLLLHGLPPSFKINEIEDTIQSRIDDVFVNLTHRDQCPIHALMVRVYSPDDLSVSNLLSELCYILFIVGVLGIDCHCNSIVDWSYKETRVTKKDFYQKDALLYVHPSLYSCLAIDLKTK